MKRISGLITLLLISFFVFGSGGEYAVTNIPESLKKNSNVVKRIEEERFTLKSPGEAVYYRKYALTILNENGDKHASFQQYYDRFIEIKGIAGALYDAMGNKVKELKNKDIQDFSGVSDISLMEDNRVKYHSFYYKVYPYTVEYVLELKYNGTMFYPSWQPLEDEYFSVQQSKFIFECPLNYEFRYKTFNYNDKATEQTTDKKRMTWEIKDMPAIVRESFSPSLRHLTTNIMFGPTEFEMQAYKGNMKSWQDLGKFIYTLKQGRDELPPNIKQKVHEIADAVTDPREKIRLLYEYMQKNTRYVSIQLGIGGWQPFDAKYVATKGYGDCKALSNYMYSILKEAGIRSYYAVIGAGRIKPNLETEFPSSQFNHAILCAVINTNDSVWLECTSQTLPSGYLSDFTDDRYALLIDETGGNLVHTPKYGLKENLQQRTINAKLDGEGLLIAEIKTNYSGGQQDRLHMLINNLSKDKVKEYLDEELEFATYTVNNFNYKENKKLIPEIEETLSVTVDHYATASGKRLFIEPNIMTKSGRKLKSGEERKYDIELDFEYADSDKIEIEIPGGYKPESIPQDVVVESKFGKYQSAVKFDQNKIIYTRSMQQFSGLFPKTDYIEMVKFYDAIYRSDRSKLVFIRTSDEVKKPF
jgi:transglutaminase-like putative cysteine protease